MTDYIFEIQNYKKGNLLKEFANFCDYELGLYYFYNDHIVVDFIDPKEYNLLIQKPITLEIYPFTIKLSPRCDNLKNKTKLKIIKDSWRAFAGAKFTDYKIDLENWLHGDYVL